MALNFMFQLFQGAHVVDNELDVLLAGVRFPDCDPPCQKIKATQHSVEDQNARARHRSQYPAIDQVHQAASHSANSSSESPLTPLFQLDSDVLVAFQNAL